MSAFEQKINSERRRFYSIAVAGALFILLFALSVGAFIAYSQGVAVSVEPEEASETANLSVESGFALVVGDAVYGLGGEVAIRAEAPGYRTERRVLTASHVGGTVQISMRPLEGLIRAQSVPALPDTIWSLNDGRRFDGPGFELEVAPGDWRLTALHPFYEPAEQTVFVPKGEEVSVSVSFSPVKGSVQLKSNPAGATVLLNDERVGQTPLSLDRTGGDYTVQLIYPGHGVVTDQFQISNNRRVVERDYQLVPQPGTMVVKAKPNDGVLIVSGRTVQLGAEIDVPPNREIQLRYQREGFKPHNQTIELTPNERRELFISLEDALATLEITSNVSAEIFVNGVPRGEAPLLLTETAVEVIIEARAPGFVGQKKTIGLKADRVSTVHFDLKTERAAAIAQSPPQYQNSLGMSFKLFTSGAFTMGAPRHEPGQRANEFLRRIELKRHFYAGLHEVTNDAFAAFTGTAPGGTGNLPVVNVSWREAAEFANWLSTREGLKPFYKFSGGTVDVNGNANGYRLLTEAEWEWLARRAGRRETVVFPWGDTTTLPKGAGNIADESARGVASTFVPNYNDGYAGAAPVGSFGAEASGLHDLNGNVSEWVHDRYSLNPPQEGTVFVDPLGADFGADHVVKGSNYRSGTRTTLRPAYREGAANGRDDIGFRLGRYLYGESNE